MTQHQRPKALSPDLVARFAHENSRRHGTKDWLTEFARQSQLFATKFPREQRAAARRC